MKLIRHLHQKHHFKKGTALTIGNFDGVHVGHQALIKQVIEHAKENNLLSLVVVFEPQPKEYFQGKHAPLRITNFRDKLELFKTMGVDFVVVIPFTESLSQLSAHEFILNYFVEFFNAKHIVVGSDFRFGYQRAGDLGTLKEYQEDFGYEIAEAPGLMIESQRVSSSFIRSLILKDEFEQAAKFLSRPFRISGRVVHGNQLGRHLGFPTANILLKRRSFPLEGIFAAHVYGMGKKPLPSAAYVGYRPAVNGKIKILEVNILDFDQEIYGQWLEVELLSKVRDDKNIDGLDALKKQIAEDVQAIKRYFLT